MKKIINNIIIYILIFIEILIIINSKSIINNILYSSEIFLFKVFPSLFPTMIIGNLLIKQGLYKIIPEFIKKIFNKLFNFNDIDTTIFITSIFTGSPSNAVYINNYIDSGLIDEKEALNLLCVTHFINPLFIVGGIGIGVFNSYKIGFILLIISIIDNIIKAFVLRNNFNNKNISIENKKEESFITSFFSSVKTAIDSCLMIFAIIIVFNILIFLINSIFNLSSIYLCIFNGILEMTSGVIKLSMVNTSLFIKLLLSYFFINFGGLCIHMQTISMLKNKKIRYLKYLIFRLF